jgi:DNA-binding GntR family transcriptional regulator
VNALPALPPAEDEALSQAEAAYRQLRDKLIMLEIRPGEPINDGQLAAELGFGRTPVREAIKRLELENLVAVHPRRATLVCDVDVGDIVNITEVRAELEGFAAELAALRMDGKARAAGEALLAEVAAMDGAHDQDWLMHFDERIHRFIWEASGNPYLAVTLERYFTHSLRIWYLVLDRVPGLGHAVRDQTRLLGALLERDGDEARRIMRDHVLEFQREILGAFRRT